VEEQDVIQTPEAAFLVLLAGAISFSSQPLRRQMAFPLGALALAIAGLRAGPGTPPPLSREVLAGLPPGFRAVTAGLVLVGIIGAVVVAIRAGRPGLWLAPGTLVAAWSARNIVSVAPIGPSLLGGAFIALLAALGLGIGKVSRIRAWVMEADLRWLGSPARASSPTRPGIVVLLAGTLSAAFSPHLSLVFAGAATASWSLWMTDRPAGVRWPVIPAVLTAVLGITYLFMATVAGPEGLSMVGLGALPISPAAETFVAAALLVASWLMSGLWPLHRFSPAPLLAPAGIAMLARVGLVVAPAGMEHWRPLAVPLGMLALWHAGARRWEPGLAVGAAWLALVSVAPLPAGVVAAAWLLPAALTFELLDVEGHGETRARRWPRRLAGMAAGWGGLLALKAGLQGEVVYTVLAGTGVVLAIGAGDQAMTPSAPRTPAPSA
jgi:hypothetical protein